MGGGGGREGWYSLYLGDKDDCCIFGRVKLVLVFYGGCSSKIYIQEKT